MRNKTLCLTLLLLALAPWAAMAQLTGSLPISLGPGTYTVIGDCWVATGNTCTILPGTRLMFTGSFSIKVSGTLHAVGTTTQKIRFLPQTTQTWGGIRFQPGSSPNSILSYCQVTGAGYQNPADPTVVNGGAISATNVAVTISHCKINLGHSIAGDGGGIYIAGAAANISDCIIYSCRARNGGAIMLYSANGSIVQGCVLYRNFSTGTGATDGGGGIRSENTSGCHFNNNGIVYNHSYARGGGFMSIGGSDTLNNNSVISNEAVVGASGLGVGILAFPGATITGRNNISYFNNYYYFIPGSPDLNAYGNVNFTFSDVQGGPLSGLGNINSDPLFVSASAYRFLLSQIAAGQTVDSPCVNAGDPNPTIPMVIGSTRTDLVQDAGVVDMGYHWTFSLNWIDDLDLMENPTQTGESTVQPNSPNLNLRNYPNPFNPTTALSFTLPQAGQVQLTVYDVAGQLVATLVDGWRAAGVQTVTFDGSELVSGIYMYRLTTGENSATGEMVRMK